MDTGVRNESVFPPVMKEWMTPDQDLIQFLKAGGPLYFCHRKRVLITIKEEVLHERT
jgi:hypothetical protein